MTRLAPYYLAHIGKPFEGRVYTSFLTHIALARQSFRAFRATLSHPGHRPRTAYGRVARKATSWPRSRADRIGVVILTMSDAALGDQAQGTVDGLVAKRYWPAELEWSHV